MRVEESPAGIGAKKALARVGKIALGITAKQRWYREHRETEIAAAKERARRKREARRQELRLTPDELAACQKDPTLAWTIRGPKWIACLEDGCGALCEQLGHHLGKAHNLKASEYKQKPGPDGVTPRYSKGASLMSLELGARLSKKRGALRLGRRLQKSGKVPPIRKLIASRGPRVLSLQYRIEQSRRLRGLANPARWGRQGKLLTRRVEDWQIAKLVVAGHCDSEIAAKVGLSSFSVWARRHRLGLFIDGQRQPCVYVRGRPLIGKDILAACKDFGKTLEQLADYMGVNPRNVRSRTYPAFLEKPLPTDMAREFKAAREKLREEFRHQATKGREGGHPQFLTLSERASLASEYHSLLPDIKAMLKWLLAVKPDKLDKRFGCPAVLEIVRLLSVNASA